MPPTYREELRDVFRTFLGRAAAVLAAYLALRSLTICVEEALITRQGRSATAEVTASWVSVFRRGRTHRIAYHFSTPDGETVSANPLWWSGMPMDTASSKVGDHLEVLYVPWFPSVNRPSRGAITLEQGLAGFYFAGLSLFIPFFLAALATRPPRRRHQ
jgi:hypothetical protein